jgi:hypothetical protein
MIHFYMTDFGVVRLSEKFVTEAKSRWPGVLKSRRTLMQRLLRVEPATTPKWHVYIDEPIKVLARKAYAEGVQIKCLKSIAALPEL